MIVRTLSEIVGSERDVCWGYGQSRRFLLEKDGMGFTLTDTTVPAGTECFIQYPYHLEACYCIEGEGELELVNGEIYPIKVGTMYALDQHDIHYVRGGEKGLRLVCVLLPALKGDERHHFDDSAEPSTYKG